jgi:acyl carrier protein phosphodiesterase
MKPLKSQDTWDGIAAVSALLKRTGDLQESPSTVASDRYEEGTHSCNTVLPSKAWAHIYGEDKVLSQALNKVSQRRATNNRIDIHAFE